jgi:hypothetical protein
LGSQEEADMPEEPDVAHGAEHGDELGSSVTSVRDLAAGAAAGDQQARRRLLLTALESDPATADGRWIRKFAGAVHAGQARDLLSATAGLSPEEAEPKRAEARQLLYEAVLIEHIRLAPVPSAGPATAAGPAGCLLDPPPDPPADVIASAMPLGARVRWTAPDDHGKAITGYQVSPTPRPLIGLTISQSGTQAEVRGLAPGTTYTFTVTATNADGTSAPSLPSNPVRPEVTPPGVPAVTGRTAGALATVDWTPPAAGAPFTGFWVTAYDATALTPLAPIRKLPAEARSTSFEGLSKGSYVYGVRAFNAGGAGDEGRSPAHTFQPAPSPFTPGGLPGTRIDPLELFDLGGASELLRPDLLQRRLGPALEKANKWRYDYLKSLAVRAASDTLQYEQFLGQVLQMTLGKVTSAQMLLSPVLQDTIDDLLDNVSTIGQVAGSAPVQDVVARVADAAGTALALEGLLFFLLDNTPFDFWVGLFDGMIRDVAHFDVGLSRTEAFLRDDYFGGLAGAQLVEAVSRLVDQIDAQVDQLMKPLEAAVDEIAAGVIEALRQVVNSIDETLVAVSTVTGNELVGVTPFPVIENLIRELKEQVQELKQSLKDLIQSLLEDPRDLLVTLIKVFIAYPILAILVISFALGPIGAGILAAIVLVAVVELVRLVARLLAGPLMDLLDDARRKVLEVLAELSAILSTTIGLLESPAEGLQQVASHLLALEQLLPREFMNGVATLIGEARRALLGQATELALAAERALGLENGTAFDVIRPNYDSGLPQAPGLPGGTDETLLAGMAMLRDINLLDRLRTRVLDGKEVVVTQRLSLFRLLGGLGDPVSGTGAVAGEIARLAGGGQLLVRLTDEAIVEQNYPGLYRAMVVDIKPIGLLAAASPVTSVLPVAIPLSVTHLGPSRMRVKRDVNPDAPPITLPEVLRKASDAFVDELLDAQLGPEGRQPAGALAAVEELALQSYRNPPLDDSGLAPRPPSITSQIRLTILRELPVLLAEHTRPILSAEAIRALLPAVLDRVFAGPLPEGRLVGAGTEDDPRRWEFPTPTQVRQALRIHLEGLNGAVTLIRDALRPVLIDAHRRQLKRFEGQVAKWAGARYEEDRDPHVRALGYVTLVQDFPVETAVFNLLPDLAPVTGGLGGVGAGPQAASPARVAEAPATALQYRAFENRGVEGDWLLSMENALTPGTLVDLLLEVTIRGCYDERLAAAVKAKRSQRAGQLDRAKAVAAAANKALTMPGTLPELLAGASDIRTLHFSLRAHRDSVLEHALAAAAAAGTRLVDGLDLKDVLAPLGGMEPFSPLAKGGLKKITLRFQREQPQSLGVLNGEIPVTPRTLGIADALTSSDAGSLVGLGLVVIPSVKVTNPPAGEPLPAPSDYVIQDFEVDPLLRPYLPQLDKTITEPGAPTNNLERNKGRALFLTPGPPTVPLSLRAIWESATGASVGQSPRLTLDLGDALDDGYIHDVIFSLSVKVPVTKLQVAPGVA